MAPNLLSSTAAFGSSSGFSMLTSTYCLYPQRPSVNRNVLVALSQTQLDSLEPRKTLKPHEHTTSDRSNNPKTVVYLSLSDQETRVRSNLRSGRGEHERSQQLVREIKGGTRLESVESFHSAHICHALCPLFDHCCSYEKGNRRLEMALLRDGLHHGARVSRCTAGQFAGSFSGVGNSLACKDRGSPTLLPTISCYFRLSSCCCVMTLFSLI